MATEWYCKIMGDEWGPMSSHELMAVARRGRLTRHDTVRRGADGTWVRAEVVKGLFTTSPPAPTATSDRAITPTPAKRSLRPLGEPRYWAKIKNKVEGPYSALQLKQMAADGTLRPIHQLSKDRFRWVLAMQVKGLTFGGGAPEAETASLRSAVVLDEADAKTLAEIVH